MPTDMQYGRRTGVTSFKQLALELCETLRKFEPYIKTWVNARGGSPSDIALILALIQAADAACAAVKALPDD